MKSITPDDIVGFLGFPGSPIDSERFKSTGDGRWKKLLLWLDDTGLPFYFLEKLRSADSTELVPPGVISRLEQDFIANQRRTEYLWRRFAHLNQAFQEAGVRYSVLKGFSLAPQFCPNASLRHQGDLDYLVDERSLAAAQKLLEAMGYRLKPPISDQEFVYLLPTMGQPQRARNYAPELHAIELHLDIWDSELNRLPMLDRMFSVDRTSVRQMNGLWFPALNDEDAFLLQVLHTCRHLFTYWTRMSCLYEIGYFFKQRSSDTSLWRRVQERASGNPMLRELTVVVSEMVAQLFSAPLPELVHDWGKQVRPAVRVWIDHYARYCSFSDIPVHQFDLLPRSKLVLFLHQQYEELCGGRHVVRNQLIAPTRIGRIKAAVTKNPLLLLSREWWRRQRIFRRSTFHVLSGIRYAAEVPRWRWLNRAQGRTVSADDDVVDASAARSNSA